MFQQKFILFTIGLIILFPFSNFPGATMEWDPNDRLLGVSLSHSPTSDWKNEETKSTGGIIPLPPPPPDEGSEKITFKTLDGAEADFKQKKKFTYSSTNNPSSSNPQEFELRIIKSPRIDAINGKYPSAVSAFFPFPRDENEALKQEIHPKFLIAIDDFLVFTNPQQVSWPEHLLKVAGAVYGGAAAFALAPLFLTLTDYEGFYIPVGGNTSIIIACGIIFTTTPPLAAQGVKFMEQIIRIFVDSKNKLKPGNVEEDRIPHTRSETWTKYFGARVCSLTAACLRAAPFTILFWEAEKSFPLYKAIFSLPLAFYYLKYTYDNSMEFWNRLAKKKDDAAGGITKYKRNELISHLKNRKEEINASQGAPFIEFLYDRMEKIEENKKAYDEAKENLRVELQGHILSGSRIDQPTIVKAAYKYIEKMLKINGLPKEVKEEVQHSIAVFLASALDKDKTYREEYFAKHLVDLIHQNIQKYGRQLVIERVVNKKKIFLDTGDSLVDKFNKPGHVLGLLSFTFFEEYLKLTKAMLLKDLLGLTEEEIQCSRGLVSPNIRALVSQPYLTALTSILPRKEKNEEEILSLKRKIEKALSIPDDDIDAAKTHMEAIVEYLKKTSPPAVSPPQGYLQKKANDLIEQAMGMLFAKEERLINNSTQIIMHFLPSDKIYDFLMKKFGALLSNGSYIPEKDTSIANFGLFLPEIETSGYKELRQKLEGIFQGLQQNSEKAQGHVPAPLNLQEATQLLPKNKSLELKELRDFRGVLKKLKEIPTDRLIHILNHIDQKAKSTNFPKHFFDNLASVLQGGALTGRFLITWWAVDKIFAGASDATRFSLSLTAATLDTLLRPQEWYIQREAYSNMRTFFSSPFESNYWPVEWVGNAGLVVNSAALVLPSVVIISKMLPNVAMPTKVLIIGLTYPVELASTCHFLKKNWGAVTQCIFKGWRVWFGSALAQKKARLNEILDDSIFKLDELDNDTIEKVYNFYFEKH